MLASNINFSLLCPLATRRECSRLLPCAALRSFWNRVGYSCYHANDVPRISQPPWAHCWWDLEMQSELHYSVISRAIVSWTNNTSHCRDPLVMVFLTAMGAVVRPPADVPVYKVDASKQENVMRKGTWQAVHSDFGERQLPYRWTFSRRRLLRFHAILTLRHAAGLSAHDASVQGLERRHGRTGRDGHIVAAPSPYQLLHLWEGYASPNRKGQKHGMPAKGSATGRGDLMDCSGGSEAIPHHASTSVTGNKTAHRADRVFYWRWPAVSAVLIAGAARKRRLFGDLCCGPGRLKKLSLAKVDSRDLPFHKNCHTAETSVQRQSLSSPTAL